MNDRERKDRRPLVLVVEDEPHLREVMRFQLEAFGFEMAEAADGAEGLRMAEALRPDAITTCLSLPRLDGYELVGRLRASSATVDIPILIVSARSIDPERIAGLPYVEYVSKPFQSRDLLARLRNLIESKR